MRSSVQGCISLRLIFIGGRFHQGPDPALMQSSGLGEDLSHKGRAAPYGSSPRIRKVWRVSSIWMIDLLGSWGSCLRPDPTSGTAPDRKSSDSICGLAASWAWPVTRALHTNARRDAAMRGPRPVTGTHRTPRAAYEPPFRSPPYCGCLWLRSGGLAEGRGAEGRSQLAAAAGRHGCGEAERTGGGVAI